MHKIVLIILLFLPNFFFAQTLEEIVSKFWEAVNEDKSEIISEKGERIILLVKESNYEIDSIILEIRLRTALAFSDLGKYSKSLEINIQTLELSKDRLKGNKNIESIIINNIAINYSYLGDFKKALEYNLLALKETELIYGSKNYRYAININNLAMNYLNSGDYIKALEFNLLNLELRKELLGKEHQDYALTLSNVALCYSKLGNYKKALEYNLLALKIRRKLYGDEHKDFAASLYNIASNYSDLGNYKKSLEFNLNAIEIIEKKYNSNHPYKINILSAIADNYSKLGDFQKSLDLNKRCLKINESNFGDDNLNYARSLGKIASDYSDLGNFQKSLEYNLIVIKILEKALGNEHPEFSTILNNIAYQYFQLGDYQKALDINIKCLKIREKYLGKNHPDYASSLMNTAVNYIYLGDYNKALEFNLLALRIYDDFIGYDLPEYTNILNSIAINYSRLGDYKSQLSFNLKALDAREKIYGKNHIIYSTSLINSADSYSNLGIYEKALELNQAALHIRKEVVGKKHPEYASNLIALSNNYMDLNDFEKSHECTQKALRIYKKVLGINHPDYNLLLSQSSLIHSHLGEKLEALKLNLKAFENIEKSVEKNHPYCSKVSLGLAGNYSRLGDISNAQKFLAYSFDLTIDSYDKNKFGLTPSLKESLKTDLDLCFHYLASINKINDSNISALYTRWIQFNGIICSDFLEVNKQIEMSNDSLLKDLIIELKSTQIHLNNYREMSIKLIQEKDTEIKTLENRVTELQIELSRRSREFAKINRAIFSKNISDALLSGEVLVDIIHFPYYNFTVNKWSDSLMYLAFITNSKDTVIDCLYIEEGTKNNQDLFDRYKQEVLEQNNKINPISSNFYNYFWKPIADKIGDAKTVYISMGGIYNNINLNTLYNPETGKYLLEEKDIRIVNSARDFVLSKEREKKIVTSTSVSLYGFPDFNGNSSVSIDTLNYIVSTRDLSQNSIDSLTRGNMKASPLPATKIEIENISSTFNKNGWNVLSYSQCEATESNIKKEKSPRVLHIATHGYFFEDIPLDTTNNRFFGMDRNQMVQDPMLRSGLLFTGANNTLKGETSIGENGLLSAAEASLLDLRETELVVLSACETGKGEVKNSEGVYGLRKAFSDAGAQNIIMSLWEVDDEVTQEFMTRFYEIWLDEKTSIREAFNRTQLEIKAKYPEPYYWGAFILVGE
jgi:CHAT domain-containing protein